MTTSFQNVSYAVTVDVVGVKFTVNSFFVPPSLPVRVKINELLLVPKANGCRSRGCVLKQWKRAWERAAGTDSI